jgi:BolA protein
MTDPSARVEAIERMLREALAPEHLSLLDESHRHRGHPGAAAGGGHFRATIVSERFEGRSRIERHRLAYAALGAWMGTEIHALSVDAFTPSEWDARRRE